MQNPSALHTKCAGGEACIDHSDKHLTLQEHTLPLRKLLIALNIFSYCGRLATNCSPVGRGCPPPWGPLTLCCCGRLRGAWVKPSEGRACQPGLAGGTDLGGGGTLFIVFGVSASWSCPFSLPWLPCYLQVRPQVRKAVSLPWILHGDLHSSCTRSSLRRPDLEVERVAKSRGRPKGGPTGEQDRIQGVTPTLQEPSACLHAVACLLRGFALATRTARCGCRF